MLVVNKLNKFYRLNKNYKIHVINDTSFVLPEKGIVAILGTSGSGKTTLLNSLCGMDKVDTGSISIDGKIITKYKSHIWDDLRNKHFGYIFQNYNLFGNETVFKNVAISLEMLGMRNRKEIEKRVIQALKVVRMDKYKNRLAKNLSGGEQQRVSIARAIAKDAKYILADEPTGNLDRKNTVTIMGILEEIAKNRLVVMVTHEKELASRYADRIMQIKDGVIISDIENLEKSSYSFTDENEFYLHDLTCEKHFNDDKIELNEYIVPVSDENSKTIDSQFNSETLDLKLAFIVKNNRVYLKATSSSHQVQYIDNNSLVQFIDGKKEEQVSEQIEDAANIYPVTEELLTHKKGISLSKYYGEGFGKIFKINFGKRLVLYMFLIASFLLTLSFGLYASATTIDESSFMESNRDMVTVSLSNNNVDDNYKALQEYLTRDEIYAYTAKEVAAKITMVYFELKEVYRGNKEDNEIVTNINIKAPIVSYQTIDNYQGPIPKDGEVVIDKLLYDTIMKNNSRFYQTDKMLVGQTLIYNDHRYKIIGYTNNNNYSYYTTTKDAYISLSDYFMSFTELNGEYTKPNGNEIIVSTSLGVAKGKTIKIGNREYKVIDTFENGDINKIVFSDELNYENYQYASFIECNTGYNQYSVLTNNHLKTLNWFEENKVKADSNYEIELANYMKLKNIVSTVVMIVAIVAFAIPSILLYFLMRSNMMSRIKEIGIYRALGLRKTSIYKMHLGEILAITTIFTVPGWLAGILFMLSKKDALISIFKVNIVVTILSFVVSVGINLLVGLLPIMNLLGKTPQEILTKYDI